MASSFTLVVPPGSFRSENLASSNAAAASWAAAHVFGARFCLTDIPSGGCVNTVYAAAIGTVGPGTPTAIGVVSGTLPPGLSFSGGMLSGIFTTPGVYNFQIRAQDSSGNYALKDYTVTVAEIVTVVLPDGNMSDPYAQAILVNGFTNPVFTIVGGALPNPLTLHPATGVISGDAPTEDGDFAFVVQVQDGNATCLQDYVLTIEGAQVQVYWPLEGPANGNTDSVSGDPLFVNNFGATLSSPPAKVGNGFNITTGFCNLSQTTQALLYTGAGFTVSVWLNWIATGAIEGFQYSFCNAPIQQLTWTVNNTGSGTFDFTYDGVSSINGPTPEPSAGSWHLVILKYDPADGNLSFSLDGGAFIVLGNVGVISVNPEPSPYMLAGNENITLDEITVCAFPFSAADVAYVWNGGVGRTFPLSFPP